MTFSVALGYPSSVWACMKGALGAVAALDPSNTVAARSTLTAALETLRRGRDCIAAWQCGQSLSALFVNLSPALAFPVSMDPTARAYVAARVAAVAEMASALNALLPLPMLSASLVAAGQPGIADPGYIEWCMTNSPEAAPAGLSAATVARTATAAASAWTVLMTALADQGVGVTGASMNACNAMAQASSAAAADIATAPFSSSGSGAASLWNAAVAIPALSRAAASLSADPTSELGQQVSLMRYYILQGMTAIATAIVNLRESLPSSVLVTKVRLGDTLMDIAARELGDYSRWRDIATLNNLRPPYIVATPPNDGSAVVSVGDQVYLPTASGIDPATITTTFNYNTNYLGTDFDFGPLNGDMPLWSGDFGTRSGYNNLGITLGRWIMTPLGALVYHSDYGSRIPASVGAIQDESQVGILGAYAASAILSDPRVDSVPSVTVTLGNGFAANIVAEVVPNGAPDGVSTTLNAVIPSQS